MLVSFEAKLQEAQNFKAERHKRDNLFVLCIAPLCSLSPIVIETRYFLLSALSCKHLLLSCPALHIGPAGNQSLTRECYCKLQKREVPLLFPFKSNGGYLHSCTLKDCFVIFPLFYTIPSTYTDKTRYNFKTVSGSPMLDFHMLVNSLNVKAPVP